MPQPLPPKQRSGLEHNALSAYEVCLELEQKATTAENLMHARILGYLILHAPSANALAEVLKAIRSCAQDEKELQELGECFRLCFICPFKSFKGRTPATTDHPGRPSFNQVREELKAGIKVAPKDHKEAKAQALVRDGYKCAVTGKYDMIAIIESLVDGQVISAAGAACTELAHILPQSTYFNVSVPSRKKDYASSVLAVLKCFGYDPEQVNGPKVHSLYNVMTMQHDVHGWFDRLLLWFENTGVANHYHVRTAIPLLQSQLPAEVTFTSSNSDTVPCPSRQLLDLHAACAKIAHLSGAGEYIDKFDRDTDDLDVLAVDGSSSAILTHVLWRSISTPRRETSV